MKTIIYQVNVLIIDHKSLLLKSAQDNEVNNTIAIIAVVITMESSHEEG